MSEAVIAAKVIWKATKTSSGMPTPAVKVGTSDVAVDSAQEGLAEAADEGAAAAEGERIAPADPDQDRRRGDPEHLAEDRQHVLGAHQAAVEEGEAGQDHHQDEDGRDQHPGGVAFVDGQRLQVYDHPRLSPSRRSCRSGVRARKPPSQAQHGAVKNSRGQNRGALGTEGQPRR